MDNLFLTQEGFIRRAAQIDDDFMLKGSFVTRQYFSDPRLRKPADLDWLYLGEQITDVDTAREIFDTWATAVTELKPGDGVNMTSFQENAFWRMIDYAMDDDFPTVNTDLTAVTGGEEIDFSLDISFNLDPELPPVGLLYQPAEGEPFYLAKSTPPANQIAWKLHQTIVRMRFKDLFDLYFMLQNDAFDATVLAQALQIYVNECGADQKDPNRIRFIINGEWDELTDPSENKKLKGKELLQNKWNQWRHKERPADDIIGSWWSYPSIDDITDYPDVIPASLEIFIQAFADVCLSSGLTALCEHLPYHHEKKRIKFFGKF